MAPHPVKKGSTAAVTPLKEPANGVKQHKKIKKNDPLKPRPARLFPPDEENPVLSSKQKSDEQLQKETAERLAAINFLNHKSVSSPVRTPPPGLLMQLIGAFLSSYGFDNTGRIFTLERMARKKFDAWKDELGKKFDKGTPSLVQIFNEWHVQWELERAKERAVKNNETSSSAEDDSGSSEENEDDDGKAVEKSMNKKTGSDSSSSSSSESGANDDEDKVKPETVKASSTGKKSTKRRISDGLSSDSSRAAETESGSSFSSSEETETPAKKRKVEVEKGKPAKTKAPPKKTKVSKAAAPMPAKVERPASSESSSSASSSESSSDESDAGVEMNVDSKVGKGVKVGSGSSTDSSKTLSGDEPQVAEAKTREPSSSSESDTSSDSSAESSSKEEEKKKPTKTSKKAAEKLEPTAAATVAASSKRKRSKSPLPIVTPASAAKVAKKSNEPFSRIPRDQPIDPRLASNKYVPYDYAQKAHEDLVITKGKGFTKEKNKKKRGSYRGGMIDTLGGKGIKFED